MHMKLLLFIDIGMACIKWVGKFTFVEDILPVKSTIIYFCGKLHTVKSTKIYFCGRLLTCEIHKIKVPMKISSYTAAAQLKLLLLVFKSSNRQLTCMGMHANCLYRADCYAKMHPTNIIALNARSILPQAGK